ncbi:MAG TPA: ComEA family DNA-binding protein [Methylococcus sp.]|nr:ComEA family DNA-binding protein [Methylococcus sp.]
MNKLIVAFILAVFSTLLFAEPIDINTATADEIAAAMKGVGKAKAEAIVREREQHGKFKSIEDLKRVKGIKDKIIAKNRDKIMVKEETAAPASAPATAPSPAATPEAPATPPPAPEQR